VEKDLSLKTYNLPGVSVDLGMSDSHEIKAFVKNILGCRCPDDVFKKILVRRQVLMNGAIPADFIINVGDRLLVTIRRHHPQEVLLNFDKIIDPWRSYRDQNGFNRLRYVIPVSPGKPTLQLINKIERLQNSDGRVNIHLIDDAKLPGIIS